MNSKKRKLHEMRKPVPNVDALVEERLAAFNQKPKPDEEDAPAGRSREKTLELLEHIVDEVTVDRPAKPLNYKATVVMPLRLTPEEARVAELENLIRLERPSKNANIWVARAKSDASVEVTDESAEHLNASDEGNATFSFPRSEFERRCALVFEDLWRKGWIITRGTNFGCDFVIYTSDPGTTHSRFMVCVMDEEMDSSHSIKLTSITALATKVRKRALLASVFTQEGTTWTPSCVAYTLVEGCLFRRGDFLSGQSAEAELSKKLDQQAKSKAKREPADADDEMGVRTSVAV